MNKNNKIYEVYTDGACTEKVGIMGIGYSIQTEDEILKTYSKKVGYGDINEAKYLAIIQGIEDVLKYNPKEIHVFSNSLLVVNQINGKWKINQDNLLKRYEEIKRLQKNKKCKIKIIWKKKDDIIIADYLALKAIGRKTK